jgi:hypothetical protein
MHDDRGEVCPKAKRGHTETRESPYGLIKWSYTKKRISLIALD